MTLKEAIKRLESKKECIAREFSGCPHFCDNCSLKYKQGTTGEQEEALDMAISALEKQIPRKTVKPESPHFRYACSSCGNYPLSEGYCGECGQRVLYDREGEE